MQARLLALVLLLNLGTARAAEIDWGGVEKQATDLLRASIQIDTTNPPGHETAAAKFLAERPQILDSGAEESTRM